MATRKKTPKPKRLHEVTDEAVDQADAFLFFGSIFGGRSLEELLEQYKELGPYHPIRNELLKHLHRCVDQLSAVDALICARAQTTPEKELRRHYDRVLPKQAKRRRAR